MALVMPASLLKISGPTLKGLVGREDDRAALIALADDLEQEVGAHLVEREIAELVHNEELRGRYCFSSALRRWAAWAATRLLSASTAVVKSTEWPRWQAS